MDNTLLRTTLQAAVTLRILEMEAHGGPTPDEVERAGDFSDVLGSKADVMLFGGGKKGEAAQLVNEMARSMAVLAFCPGGVTLFGDRYEAKR